jgi:hypothetical protein
VAEGGGIAAGRAGAGASNGSGSYSSQLLKAATGVSFAALDLARNQSLGGGGGGGGGGDAVRWEHLDVVREAAARLAANPDIRLRANETGAGVLKGLTGVLAALRDEPLNPNSSSALGDWDPTGEVVVGLDAAQGAWLDGVDSIAGHFIGTTASSSAEARLLKFVALMDALQVRDPSH